MVEKKEKRNRILSSAGKLFASQGFENTSIRQISREAGVSDGTIYNYFTDKRALLESLIEELISELSLEESRPLGLSDSGHETELKDRIVSRMKKLHDLYTRMAAVLPVILGSSELRKRFLDGFVVPVTASLEKDLGREPDDLHPRILLAAVLGFQMLLLLGDKPTARAWENPAGLADVWGAFLSGKAQ